MKLALYTLSLSALLLTASGCTKKPVLYDNAKMKSNPSSADAAIEDCMTRAKERGAEGEGKLANSAYRGAAGGVASGAAGGAAAAAGNAFGGNYDVGGSVGMSAAAGTAGNVALGLFDRDVDPIFAGYVETCLAEKGYRTIGWK